MTLAHTNIRTIDVARTVDFYRLVGLKLIGCMNLGALTTLYLGDEESEHLLEITIQAEPDPAWPVHPGTGHLAIDVPDLDSCLERLRAGGYEAEGPVFHPGDRKAIRVCFVPDPNGVRVELIDGGIALQREQLPAGLSYDD